MLMQMRCDHLKSSSYHLLCPSYLPPTLPPTFMPFSSFCPIFAVGLVHISHSCSVIVIAVAASYLEDRVSQWFSFPPLDSWTAGFWLWEKLHHILDYDSTHIQPSGGPCPIPQGYCILIGAVTVSSKSHSILQSSQMLQEDGDHGKTNEFHDSGPPVSLRWLWNKFLDQK